ncbi:hypothetical protein HNQ08_005092 [Deinococcus humi]|uniref:Uncharacterized protein n=1 Tax=Deinococcus humi TaxID=662880 RepID=A0A7W8K1V0_9DEIO|nr:hypothetical protein [Deinococcus humi]
MKSNVMTLLTAALSLRVRNRRPGEPADLG